MLGELVRWCGAVHGTVDQYGHREGTQSAINLRVRALCLR